MRVMSRKQTNKKIKYSIGSQVITIELVRCVNIERQIRISACGIQNAIFIENSTYTQFLPS